MVSAVPSPVKQLSEIAVIPSYIDTFGSSGALQLADIWRPIQLVVWDTSSVLFGLYFYYSLIKCLWKVRKHLTIFLYVAFVLSITLLPVQAATEKENMQTVQTFMKFIGRDKGKVLQIFERSDFLTILCVLVGVAMQFKTYYSSGDLTSGSGKRKQAASEIGSALKSVF